MITTSTWPVKNAETYLYNLIIHTTAVNSSRYERNSKIKDAISKNKHYSLITFVSLMARCDFDDSEIEDAVCKIMVLKND